MRSLIQMLETHLFDLAELLLHLMVDSLRLDELLLDHSNNQEHTCMLTG